MSDIIVHDSRVIVIGNELNPEICIEGKKKLKRGKNAPQLVKRLNILN